MKILAIDTSNQTLAIGLMEDGQVVGQLQTTGVKNHSTTLMPAIQQLVAQVNWQPADLQRIVVAQGPGSYTGLRIGVTTAKTLAYTLGIDLVGISSLQTVAANCRRVSGVIVPFFDARRQNVYGAAYRWEGNTLKEILPDQHIAMTELLEQLRSVEEVTFVGPDLEKFAEVIRETLPQATINQIPEWNHPNGIVLAELGSQAAATTDVHGFLPHYLKRVEAEEKWLADHQPGDEAYVEKI